MSELMQKQYEEILRENDGLRSQVKELGRDRKEARDAFERMVSERERLSAQVDELTRENRALRIVLEAFRPPEDATFDPDSIEYERQMKADVGDRYDNS